MYQFDHLVHFVDQPEHTLEQLKKEGLHVVNGGQHEDWGTYNALSYFDLSYIELIGIFDENLFQQAANKKYTLHESYQKVNRKNGFTRFAIRTTTIEEDAQKFSEAGFDVVGPTSCFRTREDGSTVSWKLLHIGYPNTKIDFPFFIQWELDDDLRREENTNRGIIAPHPLGDVTIDSIHFVVPNFKQVEQFAKLCEAQVEMKVDSETNSEIASIILPNARLKFYRPLGEGPVWDDMLEHGYSIRKIVLSGGNEQKGINCDGGFYEVTTKNLHPYRNWRI